MLTLNNYGSIKRIAALTYSFIFHLNKPFQNSFTQNLEYCNFLMKHFEPLYKGPSYFVGMI